MNTQSRIVVPAYAIVLVEREVPPPPLNAPMKFTQRNVQWRTREERRLQPPSKWSCEVESVPEFVPWNINQLMLVVFADWSAMSFYGWLSQRSSTGVDIVNSNFGPDGVEHDPKFSFPPHRCDDDELAAKVAEKRRQVEVALGLKHGCYMCGADTGGLLSCEEHCPDHKYMYVDREHLCTHCNKKRPEDWYDD